MAMTRGEQEAEHDSAAAQQQHVHQEFRIVNSLRKASRRLRGDGTFVKRTARTPRDTSSASTRHAIRNAGKRQRADRTRC